LLRHPRSQGKKVLATVASKIVAIFAKHFANENGTLAVYSPKKKKLKG
jgi:hypothetical protein